MGIANEYINRGTAIDAVTAEALERNLDSLMTDDASQYHRAAARVLAGIPAADVRPVVLCGVCELHGHCYTEDVFTFARLAEENRFCAVGKVKTNGEERTNFCPNCGADMRDEQ